MSILQIEQAVYIGRSVDNNHIDEAKSKFFHENEFLVAAFIGSEPGLGIFKQYLIVTNLRVIFWKRGFREISQTFNFEDIASVEENRPILNITMAGINALELNIKGAKETFPYLQADEISLAVKIIRESIEKRKQQSQMSIFNESIPDQIKKLAELYDSGILNEQEFQNKKAELLKRI